jgi:hypothetical protein
MRKLWNFGYNCQSKTWRKLMKPTCSLSWEPNPTPNTYSGWATYRAGDMTVAIEMDSFRRAQALYELINMACVLSKCQAIDQSIDGINRLLENYRDE